jgi:hypothetical protein
VTKGLECPAFRLPNSFHKDTKIKILVNNTVQDKRAVDIHDNDILVTYDRDRKEIITDLILTKISHSNNNYINFVQDISYVTKSGYKSTLRVSLSHYIYVLRFYEFLKVPS